MPANPTPAEGVETYRSAYNPRYYSYGLTRGFRRRNRTVREHIDDLSEFDPNSGCQLWVGALGSRKEYPKMTHNYVTYFAHRLSLLDHLGLSDSPLHALHKCDTKICVNPLHLYLGTPEDNVADRIKGPPRKSSFGWKRVTEEQRNNLSALFASGHSTRAAAKIVGVNEATARRHRKALSQPEPSQ